MATVISNRDHRYMLADSTPLADDDMKIVAIAYDDSGTIKHRVSVYLNAEEVQALIETCEAFLDTLTANGIQPD